MIRIKFTRDENIDFYNAEETEIDLDEYVRGVVASEIGNAPLEACKAMAIAARTNAMVYVNADKAISDSSQKDQAFRASRLTDKYPNAKQAAMETSGLVLYCNGKLANPASFSSNNGGRTCSSKQRWGGARSWLIEQDDPWDHAQKVTGHRVGMSQLGSANMANAGKSYQEILSFYYPTTYLAEVNAMVKASWLIDQFKFMVDNKWQYVAGAAEYGKVDCSGAFTYWYKKAGSQMYHGSNTMYRKWSTVAGTIKEVGLVPGMAVFKHRFDGKEPESYKKDNKGNFYHVGLYIGDGRVAEAKGTNYGCVYSNISEWSYCAKLKDTDYDVSDVISDAKTGVVTSNASAINFRQLPNATAKIIGTIKKGTRLTLTGEDGNWWKTTYNGKTGYVTKNFITLDNRKETTKNYTITVNTHDKDVVDIVSDYLTSKKITFELKEGESA